MGLVDRPEGWAALHAAAREAHLRQVHLVVVCSGVPNDEVARMRPKIQAAVEGSQGEPPSAGWEIRALNVGNSPVDDLVATVEEFGAQLLVIGLRRRSSVGKFLMGSDAQRVLLLAQCPVLAVKN